jgi:hypothetical protein
MFKNIKRSAYFEPSGLRVNCDGSTIAMRKPALRLMPNHFHPLKRFRRIWNPFLTGQAISDGKVGIKHDQTFPRT